jgi:hypothetical protein
VDDPDDQVTADEWLAAHRQAQAQDEARREVSEADVADEDADEDADEATPGRERPAVQTETVVCDVRETATVDVREHTDPEPGRVPTADETAEAVARAQTALAEIANRRGGDEVREAEDEAARRDQLARWSADDDRAAAEAAADDTAPVLER